MPSPPAGQQHLQQRPPLQLLRLTVQQQQQPKQQLSRLQLQLQNVSLNKLQHHSLSLVLLQHSSSYKQAASLGLQ